MRYACSGGRVAVWSLLTLILIQACQLLHADEKPYWLEAMKKVNAKFDGNPGYVGQFGDSITNSMAFWSTIGWSYPDQFLDANGVKDGFPKRPSGKRWRDIIKGARGKGADHANMSSQQVGWLLKAIEKPLKRENPEVAIVMIGTNDIRGGRVPATYQKQLEKVIEKTLAHNCIPILNTIPPFRNRMDAVKECNRQIKAVAQKYKVPLVDYYAEIMKRQPEKWDGTLICGDGVHPSGGGGKEFSPANLKVHGYQLRTWVNWLMVRELYFRILSAPKPFIEKVGKVETSVRPGLRCAVTADTEVSSYKSKNDQGDNERVWNWGKATRIKNKGFEEYAMFKFDTSKCKGMTVKRASLYLSRTEQCVMNVVEVSTISTDWREGTGVGAPTDKSNPDRGGATYSHAVYPSKTWAGAGSNFKYVSYGEGGSAFGAGATSWAKLNPDAQRPDFYVLELPLDVAHSLLVEGDSYGLTVCDAKGQRAFQKTYRRVPNPNHFLNSRESGKPCFLVIEGEVTDRTAPAPVADIACRPGKEAGEVVLSWTCTADDGTRGGSVLGYDVYVAEQGGRRTKLPRHQTYRPKNPGQTQDFWIDDLKPGARYRFEVIAYDEAGNRSKASAVSGRARAARKLPFAMPDLTVQKGAPIAKTGLKVWACPSTSRVSPVTGNQLASGNYENASRIDPFRKGNSVWNGKEQAVTVVAGSNDFAGFQLIVENTLQKPLRGLQIKLGQITQATASGRIDRLVLLSQVDTAQFQAAMQDVMARDAALAQKVFSDVKQLNTYRQMEKNDPMAFFKFMQDLKKRDKELHARWMYLISGGKSKSSRAIDMKHSRVFWEWSIPDEKGVFYPEVLMPFTMPIDIPNTDNPVKGQRYQLVYVDLYVPHNTPAGNYLCDVMVSADGVEPFSVPVQVKVHGFELPDKLSFIAEMNGYGFHSDYGGWQGVTELQRLAHRNRLHVNVVPYSHSGNPTLDEMAFGASGSGKGLVVSDLSKIDRYFGPMLTGRAFRDNPRRGVPISALYLPLYENWPVNMKAAGFQFDQEAKQLDISRDFPKAYKEGWVAGARQIFQHLKDKGYTQTNFFFYLNNKYQFAPQTTFWWLDEPMFRDDFVVIRMFGDLMREALVGFDGMKIDYRIDISRIQESRDHMDKVDLMVLSQANLREYGRVARDHMRAHFLPRPGRKAVEPWVYGGNSHGNKTNVTNRLWCTESYVFGMNGLLPWLTLGSDESWTNVEKAQHTVFFPARRWNVKGAYGSLRMKSFRDGQQDAEYLNLLSKKLGATRKELGQLVNKVVSLKATTTSAYAEDAGTVEFKAATPDKLENLRRILGHNINAN